MLCGVGIALLLALRVPSLAHPAGADQSLYIHVGQQIMAGGAPYVDAWDQKPPGVHVLYGLLWTLWPDESIVAAADLGAAMAVSVLLVVLGRRLDLRAAGWLAAALFALLGNPSLHRLSGVFVRGQCETFIGVAVAFALVMVLSPSRHWWPKAAAGIAIGVAVWLKYNAIAYVLPVWIAVQVGRRARRGAATGGRADQIAFGVSLMVVGVIGVLYLALHDALVDWRLATFDYNLRYSGESYGGVSGFVGYAMALPFRQARYDMLWFLGGIGLLASLWLRSSRRAAGMATAWTAAAIVSIVLNSGRDLPQYFVQAWPALAWTAGVGLTALWQTRRVFPRTALIGLVLLGLWRVGVDTPVAGGFRLAGLGGLADNVRFDLAHMRGQIDRSTYLARFGGQRDQDKFAALDVEDLASHVRSTTRREDPIFVFGFSPGVYVKGLRQSASRFFWSRPVVIGFEAHRPRYGTAGLLEELTSRKPAIVALQKRDWAPGEPNSEEFFLSDPRLSDWLARNYRLEEQRRLYSVWRRVE